MSNISIGVFGGSGFYKFGENVEEVIVETPYGRPSSKVFVATISGKKVAFLPRHGVDHRLPPHEINYRANVFAMKKLGVKFVVGPCAVGSVQLDVKPGDIMFCDQFVNKAFGRKDTFYDGPIVTHMPCADPYCPNLRELAFKAADEVGVKYHKTGTVVITNGPRFETRAEASGFGASGWHVVNMTQYPEVILARELEMCYLNISIVTNYSGDVAHQASRTEAQDVVTMFNQNIDRLKKLLFVLIRDLPEDMSCSCHKLLEGARFST